MNTSRSRPLTRSQQAHRRSQSQPDAHDVIHSPDTMSDTSTSTSQNTIVPQSVTQPVLPTHSTTTSPVLPQPVPPTSQVLPNPDVLPMDPHFRNKLERFDGTDDTVRVQTWLTLFEVHTSPLNDSQRIRTLIYSLKGPALEWFGDEIAPHAETITWSETKDKFIRRFGVATSTPLIDAQRRRLKREETVEQYYKAKMRLLRRTHLIEQEVVQQLTDGLPFSWKLSMTAAKPTDSNTWVELAQQIETHFASANNSNRPNQFRKPFQPKRNFTPRSLNVSQAQRKIPQCRFCQKRGLTEFHWHRDCPNNTQVNQRNPATNQQWYNRSNNYSNNQAPSPNVQTVTPSYAAVTNGPQVPAITSGAQFPSLSTAAHYPALTAPPNGPQTSSSVHLNSHSGQSFN